jgi:hypothetical protein
MKIDSSVFVYPMSNLNKIDLEHPYIGGLCSALMSAKFNIVNYGKKSKIGIIDVINYKFDIIYLNWVEDIAKGKFGFFQFLFTIFFIYYSKILNKKIVWTHHNVHSHVGVNFFNTFMTNFLIRNSTHIVIHTEESKKYIDQKYWDKLHYFFHPITDFSDSILSSNKPYYDILMWGAVRQSKAIDTFLEYLEKHQLLEKIKIHIVGKIQDPILKQKILRFQSSSIVIEDRFVDTNELQVLHSNARFVIFSYAGSSVLNSGVVVKSLPMMTRIIGPNKGSFVDLNRLGLLEVYNVFQDVIEIILHYDKKKNNKGSIKDFCREHTWVKMGVFLDKTLK